MKAATGYKWIIASALLGVGLVAPANARRVVVDQSDPKNPAPDVLLDGYCDASGDDCVANTLPYSIDFGNGLGPVDSFFIRGDGLLQFGSGPLNADARLGFQNPSLAANVGQKSELGIGNFPNDAYFQSARFENSGGGALVFRWFTCNTSKDCNESGNLPEDNTITFNPVAGGFSVTFDASAEIFNNFDKPFVSYLDVLGKQGTEFELTAPGRGSFFLAAAYASTIPVGAVPEPASWAMLLTGFGLAGMAVRRSGRSVARPAAA